MKGTPGCKRMIFIRAGNYDYAEVEFEGSIHLVGRNNVGKTSIISAVQFLFIGDQNDMRFDGYSLEDTPAGTTSGTLPATSCSNASRPRRTATSLSVCAAWARLVHIASSVSPFQGASSAGCSSMRRRKYATSRM